MRNFLIRFAFSRRRRSSAQEPRRKIYSSRHTSLALDSPSLGVLSSRPSARLSSAGPLFVHPSVYPSVRASVRPFVPYVRPSIRFVHPSVRSVCPFIRPSGLGSSVRRSICPSVCPFIHPSVRPSVCLSHQAAATTQRFRSSSNVGLSSSPHRHYPPAIDGIALSSRLSLRSYI